VDFLKAENFADATPTFEETEIAKLLKDKIQEISYDYIVGDEAENDGGVLG
jgi:hypothetical protein